MEDYTGIKIKDTYQSVIHVGKNKLLYDGTGSFVEIKLQNTITSSNEYVNKNIKELLYCEYFG